MIEYKTSSRPGILFVGINPHPGSYRRGVPFSNNKMFWYLLSRSGLVREPIDKLRSDTALKEVYDTLFVQTYGLNFINLVDRPTVQVKFLKKGEEKFGVERLRRLIENNVPKVVCFVGKVTFGKFTGKTQSDYGWQPDIFRSKVYLMHTPIRGFASVRISELEEIKRVAFGTAAGQGLPE